MSFAEGLAGFANASNSVFSQLQHWDGIKEQRAQRELQERDMLERNRLAEIQINDRRQQVNDAHMIAKRQVDHAEDRAFEADSQFDRTAEYQAAALAQQNRHVMAQQALQQAQLTQDGEKFKQTHRLAERVQQVSEDKIAYAKEQEVLGGFAKGFEDMSVKHSDKKGIYGDPQYGQLVNTTLANSPAARAAVGDAFNIPPGVEFKPYFVKGETVAMVRGEDGEYTPYKDAEGKVVVLTPEKVEYALRTTTGIFGKKDNVEMMSALTSGAGQSIPYLQLTPSGNANLANFSYTDSGAQQGASGAPVARAPVGAPQNFAFDGNTSLGALPAKYTPPVTDPVFTEASEETLQDFEGLGKDRTSWLGSNTPLTRVDHDLLVNYPTVDSTAKLPTLERQRALANIENSKRLPKFVEKDREDIANLSSAIAKAEKDLADNPNAPAGTKQYAESMIARDKKRLAEIKQRYTGAPRNKDGQEGLNSAKTQTYIDELSAKFPDIGQSIKDNPAMAEIVASTEGKRVTPRVIEAATNESTPMEQRAKAYTLLAIAQGKAPDVDTVTRLMQGDNSTADDRAMAQAELTATIESHGKYQAEMAKIQAEITKEQFAEAKKSQEAAQKLIEDNMMSLADDLVLTGVPKNIGFDVKDIPLADQRKAVYARIMEFLGRSSEVTAPLLKAGNLTPRTLAVVRAEVRKQFNLPGEQSGGVFSDARPNPSLEKMDQSVVRGSKYDNFEQIEANMLKAASRGDPQADALIQAMWGMDPEQKRAFINDTLNPKADK